MVSRRCYSSLTQSSQCVVLVGTPSHAGGGGGETLSHVRIGARLRLFTCLYFGRGVCRAEGSRVLLHFQPLTPPSPACLSSLRPLPPPPPLCKVLSFGAAIVRPRHRLVRETRLAFLHVLPAASSVSFLAPSPLTFGSSSALSRGRGTLMFPTRGTA